MLVTEYTINWVTRKQNIFSDSGDGGYSLVALEDVDFCGITGFLDEYLIEVPAGTDSAAVMSHRQ